jgi:D-alanine-D-alanine ligase-like ATP-grasp enzyme
MIGPSCDQLSHIIVFAPYIEKDGVLVSPHYDMPEYRAEVDGWMKSIGLTWEWQAVTANSLPRLLQEARQKALTQGAMVLNLCDGSDSDGYPGIEVVVGLEDLAIPHTGANEAFYRITTSKAKSKSAMIRHGVQTAPFALILDIDRDLPRAAAEIGFPLFIKPDVSAGSCGIQIDSVCYDLDAAHRKLLQLQNGMHNQCFGGSAILAERFIEGREFTVLVVEDSNEPMGLWALQPGERVFNKRLPPRERFLAFERYWGMPERERPIPDDESYYWYEAAPNELCQKLETLARRAIRAVGGVAYARVDIRLDESTGLLNVLEVNAQCGLSSDDSSTVGSLLRLSGNSMQDVMERVLRSGWIRKSNRFQ